MPVTSAAPMAMLRLSDLTVRRGPNLVVEGLDLAIPAGGVFWVVGPNGAGKTSLLRVMAGIDRPTAGTTTWSSAALAAVLYFQSEMALPPSATVGDWERVVLRLLPAGGDSARTALWPQAGPGRRVGRLSTGERKRLLLDALFRCPGSLLLDEPFEHLSPDAKVELARLMEVRARTHVVVVATNQATRRAGRDGGLHLEGGVAEALGPAAAGVVP